MSDEHAADLEQDGLLAQPFANDRILAKRGRLAAHLVERVQVVAVRTRDISPQKVLVMVAEHQRHAATGFGRLQAQVVQAPQDGKHVAATVGGVTCNGQMVGAKLPSALRIHHAQLLQRLVEVGTVAFDVAQNQQLIGHRDHARRRRRVAADVEAVRALATGDLQRTLATTAGSDARAGPTCLPLAIGRQPNHGTVEKAWQGRAVAGAGIERNLDRAAHPKRHEQALVDARFTYFHTGECQAQCEQEQGDEDDRGERTDEQFAGAEAHSTVIVGVKERQL